MISGNRLFIAEAFVQPQQVVWRVATARGYEHTGGEPDRWSGALQFTGWDYEAEGVIRESQRAFVKCADRLQLCARRLESVMPLPLGTVPNLV